MYADELAYTVVIGRTSDSGLKLARGGAYDLYCSTAGGGSVSNETEVRLTRQVAQTAMEGAPVVRGESARACRY